MAESYSLVLRPDWPGLMNLDWGRSITEWRDRRLVDLPRGLSRHEVRFMALDEGIFALKELPEQAARRDYNALRRLEALGGSAVRAAGLVVRRDVDPGSERAAVLATRYLDYSFSYRELLQGEGFGARRSQMLDAFAFLMVELHLLGCFWGDCSLSNVLLRYDAGAIETVLVDAETAELHPRLSNGQRHYDLDLMADNVGAEMGDIAASRGVSLDDADLTLGADIRARYQALWGEVGIDVSVPADKQYLVTEQIQRLNELGFEVEELELVSHLGRNHLHAHLKVADRNFHANRLRELTGVEAAENQGRQILSDLRYFEMKNAATAARTESGKALLRARWRVEEFEPWLRRLARHLPATADPVQAYCDLLHHRYLASSGAGRDVGTEKAFEDWLAAGRPGYALPGAPADARRSV